MNEHLCFCTDANDTRQVTTRCIIAPYFIGGSECSAFREHHAPSLQVPARLQAGGTRFSAVPSPDHRSVLPDRPESFPAFRHEYKDDAHALSDSAPTSCVQGSSHGADKSAASALLWLFHYGDGLGRFWVGSMLVLHSKMLLYPRELYQRGVQRKRVEMIATDFNEYVANEPKVSFRNGKYYVVDGQHTIEGRILRNGGKDLPILCKVYTGLTMEQEALFFAEQNGHSAPLTAGIKLRAKVVGGDAPSKAFLAATNRVGLTFNYDSLQLSDYRISCVGTALKLYNQMGEKIYCESLRLIVAAWEGKPDSFRASVLRGVMHFVELYHGEFSEERLIRALGSVHPMEIYRVGRDNPAKLPGWKKYVFPIYMAYNGKGRKDALPMKF